LAVPAHRGSGAGKGGVLVSAPYVEGRFMGIETEKDTGHGSGKFKPGNAYAWKPGQSGSPKGPARGTRHGGRMNALRTLDKMLNKSENMAKLERSLQRKFNRDPVGFFEAFVMPLLPKQAMGMLESGGRVIEWRGMTSVAGDEPPPPMIEPSADDGGGTVLDMEQDGDREEEEG